MCTERRLLKNLHMRTIVQHTSCLYFYDICIITCQLEVKWDTDDRNQIFRGGFSFD